MVEERSLEMNNRKIRAHGWAESENIAEKFVDLHLFRRIGTRKDR